MSIEHILQGDYEGAIADAGRSVAKGASDAGEQARKALQALEARMDQEAGPQNTRDAHGPAGVAQNNGREAERRRNQKQKNSPTPNEPGR